MVISQKVAIFVDGDNVGKSYASEILSLAVEFGEVFLARVYGNQQNLSAWSERSAFQVIFAGNGKNGSDILIAIDAMELALTKSVDVILLCSSDADFAHLARRLREHGKKVVGCSDSDTPNAFRGACSEFHYIESKRANSEKPKEQVPISVLDRQIKALIAEHSQNGQGVRIQTLGTLMNRKHGVKISEQAEKTWRAYLAKREQLYSLDPAGPDAKVRFKPKGFNPSP